MALDIPEITPVTMAARVLLINVPSNRLPMPTPVSPDRAPAAALLATSCQLLPSINFAAIAPAIAPPAALPKVGAPSKLPTRKPAVEPIAEAKETLICCEGFK